MKTPKYKYLMLILLLAVSLITLSQSLENKGNTYELSPKWYVDYSTDDDFYVWMSDPELKKPEVCLISKTATKTQDLNDKELYLSNKTKGDDKISEPKIKSTKLLKTKTGFKTDVYGYCYTVKDKEKYIKFGEHSTVIVYSNESIDIKNSTGDIILEVQLSSDNLEYKNGKPNINLNKGNQKTHELTLTNPTSQIQLNVLENTTLINMETEQEFNRNYEIKVRSFINKTINTFDPNCTGVFGTGQYCTPYVNGTTNVTIESWNNISSIDLSFRNLYKYVLVN